jgi:PhnB protein
MVAKKKKAAKRSAKANTKAKKSSKKVQPIPARYSSVIPIFAVQDCAGAVAFMQEVLGAKVKERYDGPGGVVMHCELRVGDTSIMCGDTASGTPAQALRACLYVKDCDAVIAKALARGASIDRPITNQFYGDRSGSVIDKWGNNWTIATHVEDVSKKEMMRRMQAMQSQQPAA